MLEQGLQLQVATAGSEGMQQEFWDCAAGDGMACTGVACMFRD